jgi:hypothetical protein
MDVRGDSRLDIGYVQRVADGALRRIDHDGGRADSILVAWLGPFCSANERSY